MIEEQAVVVDREGDYVWVQTQRQSICGACSAQKGCGTSILTKILGNKTSHLRCRNSAEVKIGDRVLIGIEESALLNGSMLIYFLPLFTMIIFAALSVFLAKNWWPEAMELFSIIASAGGLMLGLALARSYSRTSQAQKRYQPVILRKLEMDTISVKSLTLRR